MQVTFLGGANEIGASCAAVDVDGIRVLVDCGQRLGGPPGMGLPHFAFLENGPPIAAVLLTHAHADHIGSLPALEPFLPPVCPIFGTAPTLSLAKVMLEDSVRIARHGRRRDGEVPLFSPGAVAGAMARLQTARWGKSILLAGRVRATWFPAGHILGASMIELVGAEQSILFTGDISVADQVSVPGVFAPSVRPIGIVLESTYGNRLHAHRPAQEQRIIDEVRACVAAGGHVLFPTFALGRAQEVLLLLGRAMRQGDLSPIPVHADGLVRAVSRVYGRFPDDLSIGCRRLWEQGLDPIFPEDLPIRPVRSQPQRQTIADGGPCVVVSSSGMLQGGASQFYARHWLGEPENLVLITGYQDEESPGQALLSLSVTPSDQPRYFRLDGVETPVRCRVESCSLSAHADNGELASLAGKLQPEVIYLVHGDTEAREGLARTLLATQRARVVLPTNGETHDLEATVRRPAANSADRVNPLALWPPWDPVNPRPLELVRFHQWLASLTPRPHRVTVEELAELWKSPEPVTTDDYEQLRRAIYEQPQPYFVPDAKRPYLLQITPLENLSLAPSVRARQSVEVTTGVVRDLFPSESGLRRFGFFPEDGVVRLEFEFPRAARRHYQERLGELTRRSGWHWELNDATRGEDLVSLLARWGGEIDIAAVDIRHEEGVVYLKGPIPKIDRPAADVSTRDESASEVEDDARGTIDPFAELADRFRHRTGYRMVRLVADASPVREIAE